MHGWFVYDEDIEKGKVRGSRLRVLSINVTVCDKMKKYVTRERRRIYIEKRKEAEATQRRRYG